MKVPLDEDVPHELRNELPGHDVTTVAYAGWAGAKNDILLGLASAAGFDVIVTCDRSIQHQQNISALGLAVIVLAVRDTRTPTILPLAPDILSVLGGSPQPGTLSVVGTWRAPGT